MNIVTDKNGYALLFRHNCKTERCGLAITDKELQEFAIGILPNCINGIDAVSIIEEGPEGKFGIVEIYLHEKVKLFVMSCMVNATISEKEREIAKSSLERCGCEGVKKGVVKMGFYCLKTSEVTEGICGADFFVRFSGIEYL